MRRGCGKLFISCYNQTDGYRYSVAQMSIDTIDKVLNIKCEVTFTPLCRSVCHPDAKMCPIFYKPVPVGRAV